MGLTAEHDTGGYPSNVESVSLCIAGSKKRGFPTDHKGRENWEQDWLERGVTNG